MLILVDRFLKGKHGSTEKTEHLPFLLEALEKLAKLVVEMALTPNEFLGSHVSPELYARSPDQRM